MPVLNTHNTNPRRACANGSPSILDCLIFKISPGIKPVIIIIGISIGVFKVKDDPYAFVR